MSLDLPAFDAALKQIYTNERVQNLTYKRNPLFALLSKMEQFGGRNLPIPLIYANPQGRSHTFSNAQARGAATNSKLQDFVLTRVKDYSLAQIDNETLLASQGNANAFIEAATTEIDGAISAITNNMGLGVYTSGYGERGVIGAIATDVVTLASVGDITNIEVGMMLVAAATLTGVLRAGQAEVVAVNRSNGSFTLDAVANITGLAVGDYIYVQGDRGAAVDPDKIGMSGLDAWVPQVAPTTGDNFFGVDRSLDVTRLSGHRFNGLTLPIEEALIEGEAQVARGGYMLDHYFMSHQKYADLKKSLGSKVQYYDAEVADVSFRGVQIEGTEGTINVLPDRNCPDGVVWGLGLDMWKYYSLGKAVRVLDTDGLQMLRTATSDGVEVRYGGYGNMASRAPAYAVRIQVPA